MAKVYQVSGTVRQTNELLAGTSEYEREWVVVGAGQMFAESDEEARASVLERNPLTNNAHNRMEIRDLSVEYVCDVEFNPDGSMPLCGDAPDGGHWSWFGNHEPDCQKA